MKEYSSFEDLIRAYVRFTGPPQRGWNSCYCEHCGDGSRTKGPRGGWLFQDGLAFYNCFNAGCEGSFDIERDHPLSKSMIDIMQSFGIPMREYKLLQLKLKKNATGIKTAEQRRTQINKIEIPSHFYKLSDADADDDIAIAAKKFLLERRIDPTSYPFYLSTGVCKNGTPRDKELAKLLRTRLIIPAFRGDDMIYYQGRDLGICGPTRLKYVSPDLPRSGVIYGYNRLYENLKSPLFVTEGWFDSHLLNGVAVMENKLTSQQIELLSRSPRPKVIVPDRKGDSKRLAEDAIKAGFGVSIPNWGDCKDVNEAVMKYGRLYVAKCVVDEIKFGNAAKLAVKMLL